MCFNCLGKYYYYKGHNCPVVYVRWVDSQSKSLIFSRTIANGEIDVGCIIYPMV